MKSTKTIIVGSRIIYVYPFSEMRSFVERGRIHGDVGMIVTEENNGFITYKGFGTIEHPCRHISTLVIKFDPKYDTPYKPKQTSYDFKILNL